MKKIIALLLVISSVTLTACTLKDAEDDTSDDTIDTLESENETESETESETENKKTEETVEAIDYVQTELKSATYENGTFILTFSSAPLELSKDSVCKIGVISSASAESYDAVIDFDSHPEFLIMNNLYSAVAVRPTQTIPAGTYRFSVTIDTYMMSFELEIK